MKHLRAATKGILKLVEPWVLGYRRPVFWNEWWHMVDIDPSRVPAVKK